MNCFTLNSESFSLLASVKWRFLATFLIASALLAACSPTFNWRAASLDIEASTLAAMLPCKPDQAVRSVVLGTNTLSLHMLGCEAGGATFTVAGAQVAEPALLSPTLAAWQSAMAVQLKASAPGALERLALPGATAVAGSGRQSLAGAAANAQVAWFARGLTLYQAAIYTQDVNTKLPADTVDSFFEGLRLP